MLRTSRWPGVCGRLMCAASLTAAPLASAPAEPPDPVAAGRLPQYIFFSRMPNACWSQGRPASYTPESVQELVKTIGTTGNPRLRVGVAFQFSILENKADALADSLRALLAAAQAADVPVLVMLDGQNWWESRWDLWNWWDPSLPGYDPENRANVEWTGWGPEHAVKVGWRNWGRQHRVAPAPNLASPRFLAEHWRRYDVLVPIMLRWYRELPENRKRLFGGVKVGWEASINVNAWYAPDGNRLFERYPTDTAHDPTDHDPEKGWTFGCPPLGYAGASTNGIKQSGQLTRQDIEEVVRRYLEQCSRQMHDRGVPSELVFTHQGGNFAPWDKHLSFKPAMNAYSIPGWSFYSHDPAECGSLAADLDSAHRSQWVAAEWWRGAATRQEWKAHFLASLRFKACRFICVYNWEPFAKDPEALAAVRELVSASASDPGATAPTKPAR